MQDARGPGRLALPRLDRSRAPRRVPASARGLARRRPGDRGAPGRGDRLLAPHERHRLERRGDPRDDRPLAGARGTGAELLLPGADRPGRGPHRHHAGAVRARSSRTWREPRARAARPDGPRRAPVLERREDPWSVPVGRADGLLIRAKCAPHFRRVLYELDPRSPLLANYAHGSCPAGKYYCRITPTGDVTPCPYMPVAAGNLRETGFAELWERAQVFADLRDGPARRPLRRLRVPRDLRRLPLPRLRDLRRLPRRGPGLRLPARAPTAAS